MNVNSSNTMSATNGDDINCTKMCGDNTVPPKDDLPFTFSPEPTLEQLRQIQNTFSKERNWGKFHQPRNLLLALVGEVGELAELFQWRGEVKDGLPGWTEPEREHVAQEMSDVLIYLVRLAEKCHIDLPTAAVRKIELNRIKYPVDKVCGSSKKYTEYTAD